MSDINGTCDECEFYREDTGLCEVDGPRCGGKASKSIFPKKVGVDEINLWVTVSEIISGISDETRRLRRAAYTIHSLEVELERMKKETYLPNEGELRERFFELESKLTKITKQRDKLKEALIWCSGSEDFSPGGRARAGWEKMCDLLLKSLE
jgi:hypothetical protein